jgi:quercetin dioxygenase-like cupin family protein
MVRVISEPKRIEAHGKPVKVIEEFVGRMNTGTDAVSVARMVSPAGWSEPGQTPEFAEYSIVLKGALQVETRGGVYRVEAGQAVIVEAGEWVRYSTPEAGGAEYVAVCLPAFSPQTVHRDG